MQSMATTCSHCGSDISLASRSSTAAGGDLYQADLSKVKCPTLILHGAADPLVPSVHPETIHRGIVGSEFYNFPEGKHNIHKRYAEEFNRVVLAFLERTKPSVSNLYQRMGTPTKGCPLGKRSARGRRTAGAVVQQSISAA